jgi:poly(ADP-ribose) glycohydrolase ARH3
MSPSSRERFLGCLLGQAVGDALGAPFEGFPADHIYWMVGLVDDLLTQSSNEVLKYTDDTQMMIGVAETLLEHGEIQTPTLCRRFMENYDPERGYGPGARQIIEQMANGGDWETLSETIFPGGSFGNGAAMRVAPLGLLFSQDTDRLLEQTRLSALPTHKHPLGIEGAQLLALGIALAMKQPPFDRKEFYRLLLSQCQSEEFDWQLRAARKLKRYDSFGFLGNGLPAHRSVVTAIACFTTSPNSFEETVFKAIRMGDDTDTIAAMAGALSGTYLGIQAIPKQWIERLERGPKGGEYLTQLAEKLYRLYLQTSQVPNRDA